MTETKKMMNKTRFILWMCMVVVFILPIVSGDEPENYGDVLDVFNNKSNYVVSVNKDVFLFDENFTYLKIIEDLEYPSPNYNYVFLKKENETATKNDLYGVSNSGKVHRSGSGYSYFFDLTNFVNVGHDFYDGKLYAFQEEALLGEPYEGSYDFENCYRFSWNNFTNNSATITDRREIRFETEYYEEKGSFIGWIYDIDVENERVYVLFQRDNNWDDFAIKLNIYNLTDGSYIDTLDVDKLEANGYDKSMAVGNDTFYFTDSSPYVEDSIHKYYLNGTFKETVYPNYGGYNFVDDIEYYDGDLYLKKHSDQDNTTFESYYLNGSKNEFLFSLDYVNDGTFSFNGSEITIPENGYHSIYNLSGHKIYENVGINGASSIEGIATNNETNIRESFFYVLDNNRFLNKFYSMGDSYINITTKKYNNFDYPSGNFKDINYFNGSFYVLYDNFENNSILKKYNSEEDLFNDDFEYKKNVTTSQIDFLSNDGSSRLVGFSDGIVIKNNKYNYFDTSFESLNESGYVQKEYFYVDRIEVSWGDQWSEESFLKFTNDTEDFNFYLDWGFFNYGVTATCGFYLNSEKKSQSKCSNYGSVEWAGGLDYLDLSSLGVGTHNVKINVSKKNLSTFGNWTLVYDPTTLNFSYMIPEKQDFQYIDPVDLDFELGMNSSTNVTCSYFINETKLGECNGTKTSSLEYNCNWSSCMGKYNLSKAGDGSHKFGIKATNDNDTFLRKDWVVNYTPFNNFYSMNPEKTELFFGDRKNKQFDLIVNSSENIGCHAKLKDNNVTDLRGLWYPVVGDWNISYNNLYSYGSDQASEDRKVRSQNITKKENMRFSWIWELNKKQEQSDGVEKLAFNVRDSYDGDLIARILMTNDQVFDRDITHDDYVIGNNIEKSPLYDQIIINHIDGNLNGYEKKFYLKMNLDESEEKFSVFLYDDNKRLSTYSIKNDDFFNEISGDKIYLEMILKSVEGGIASFPQYWEYEFSGDKISESGHRCSKKVGLNDYMDGDYYINMTAETTETSYNVSRLWNFSFYPDKLNFSYIDPVEQNREFYEPTTLDFELGVNSTSDIECEFFINESRQGNCSGTKVTDTGYMCNWESCLGKFDLGDYSQGTYDLMINSQRETQNGLKDNLNKSWKIYYDPDSGNLTRKPSSQEFTIYGDKDFELSSRFLRKNYYDNFGVPECEWYVDDVLVDERDSVFDESTDEFRCVFKNHSSLNSGKNQIKLKYDFWNGGFITWNVTKEKYVPNVVDVSPEENDVFNDSVDHKFIFNYTGTEDFNNFKCSLYENEFGNPFYDRFDSKSEITVDFELIGSTYYKLTNDDKIYVGEEDYTAVSESPRLDYTEYDENTDSVVTRKHDISGFSGELISLSWIDSQTQWAITGIDDGNYEVYLYDVSYTKVGEAITLDYDAFYDSDYVEGLYNSNYSIYLGRINDSLYLKGQEIGQSTFGFEHKLESIKNRHIIPDEIEYYNGFLYIIDDHYKEAYKYDINGNFLGEMIDLERIIPDSSDKEWVVDGFEIKNDEYYIQSRSRVFEGGTLSYDYYGYIHEGAMQNNTLLEKTSLTNNSEMTFNYNYENYSDLKYAFWNIRCFNPLTNTSAEEELDYHTLLNPSLLFLNTEPYSYREVTKDTTIDFSVTIDSKQNTSVTCEWYENGNKQLDETAEYVGGDNGRTYVCDGFSYTTDEFGTKEFKVVAQDEVGYTRDHTWFVSINEVVYGEEGTHAEPSYPETEIQENPTTKETGVVTRDFDSLTAEFMSKPSIFIFEGTQHFISGDYDGDFYGYQWDGEKWIPDKDVVNGLGDVGDISLPNVFSLNGKKRLLAGKRDGGFISYTYSESDSEWINDFSIKKGLNETDGYSDSTLFLDGNSKNLIVGSLNESLTGYSYNSTNGWIVNDTVVGGINLDTKLTSPHVFELNNMTNLVVGSYNGTYHGYTWTGSSWTSNSTVVDGIESGLFDSGSFVSSFDDQRRILLGSYNGDYKGYLWNGTTWKESIEQTYGLGKIYFMSNTEIVDIGGKTYVISGSNDGNFFGYLYENETFTFRTNITQGLENNGDFSSLGYMTMDGMKHLIVNYFDGTFDGYTWDGSSWQNNNTITNYPEDKFATNCHIDYVDIDGIKNSILSCLDSDMKGYTWDGNQWDVNNSLVNNLSQDIWSLADFKNTGTDYIVGGLENGRYRGYRWNENHWVVDEDASSGLSDDSMFVSPSIYTDDGYYLLIAGTFGGQFVYYDREEFDGVFEKTIDATSDGINDPSGSEPDVETGFNVSVNRSFEPDKYCTQIGDSCFVYYTVNNSYISVCADSYGQFCLGEYNGTDFEFERGSQSLISNVTVLKKLYEYFGYNYTEEELNQTGSQWIPRGFWNFLSSYMRNLFSSGNFFSFNQLETKYYENEFMRFDAKNNPSEGDFVIDEGNQIWFEPKTETTARNVEGTIEYSTRGRSEDETITTNVYSEDDLETIVEQVRTDYGGCEPGEPDTIRKCNYVTNITFWDRIKKVFQGEDIKVIDEPNAMRIQTQNGRDNFNLIVAPNSTVERSFMVENIGDTELNLKLYCGGSFCSNVDLNYKEIVLPEGENKDVLMNIDVPARVPEKKQEFNIFVQKINDSNFKGSLPVTLTVDDILGKLQNLFSIKTMFKEGLEITENIVIPNFVLFVLVTAFSFIMFTVAYNISGKSMIFNILRYVGTLVAMALFLLLII